MQPRRVGSSKPVSQSELLQAQGSLKLLKAKLSSKPPPYFPDFEASAPAVQGNYRKAFKPQLKGAALQEEEQYEAPPVAKVEPRRTGKYTQAKAAPVEEEEDYYQPPPAAKKEARRPPNYGNLEETGGHSSQPEGAESSENDGREECPDCGRKFNAEAMAKHARICKKVFMTKRKRFDISSKRAAEGADEVTVVDDYMPANRRNPAARPPPKAAAKNSKWKRQSEQFRANLRAARTGDSEGYEEARRQAEDEDMTRCPHCKRTFNPDAAKRHIPLCEKKAKNAGMLNRNAKPAFRGRR
jgi:hypothetical protein